MREAFDDLAKTMLEADLHQCPAGSYTSKAVTYMRNQEVYLRELLNDSNIASNNSKCERKFAFFATLRNQIKMFGSPKGAEIAAGFESIEQTAREHTDNTRIYYKYLLEKMCPFIREKKRKDPDADFSTMKEMQSFLAWSEGFKTYREEILKGERTELAM